MYHLPNKNNDTELAVKDILSDLPIADTDWITSNSSVMSDDYLTPEDLLETLQALRDEQPLTDLVNSNESDEDTLLSAQAMGQQLGEDLEHPQELNIARDVDNAEEYLRTH